MVTSSNITIRRLDRTDAIHNKQVRISTGQIISEAYQYRRSTIDTTAVRHRVKPKPPFPLRTTFLTFDSVEFNVNVYTRFAATSYFSGDVDFVMNGPRFSNVRSSTTDDQVAEAYARATSKFEGDDINLGELLTDLKSTSSMITKRIGDLVTLGNAIRKADINKLKSLLKGELTNKQGKTLKALPQSKRIANTWLEYQYGWMPVINDIYGGIEYLSKKSEDVGAEVSRRSGRIVPVKSRNPALDTTAYFANRQQAQAQVTIKARVVNKRARDLQQLGLINPALIAWNAMPLSFVVDWVVPVGKILGSLTWDTGLKVEDVAICRETISESGRSGITSRKGRIITRERLQQTPSFLTIAYGLLKKEVSFSVNKAITSTALLRQLFVK